MVVVASAIITVILVMLFGAWPNVWQRRYEIHVKFPEAPGITVDTPVRKSGVLIGRVSNVKLLEEGGVLVGIRVFDQFKLRRHETCRIGTGSLLGDAIVEFVPSDQGHDADAFRRQQERPAWTRAKSRSPMHFWAMANSCRTESWSATRSGPW